MRRSVRAGGMVIEYELIQTARSSVEIRALPGEVRLFTPHGYPLKQADRAVADKIDFILSARGRLEAYRAAENEKYPMTDGMPVPLEGKTLALRLVRGTPERMRVEGDALILRAGDVSPDGVREALRRQLVALASERISQRVEHYIPLIGRRPGRITIREQRTKWGSCSSQGNLNFNWKLIMAPKEALDYVVIHELCHLYEFNHSDRFWARVARYQPDYAVWRGFLRSGWAHPF